MQKLAVLLVVMVAGCAPRPAPMIQGDPTAVAALLATTDAQFFAQTALAQKVANACPSISFNDRFNQALIAHRFGGGRRGLAAAANTRAIDLEEDVATRSLQARYDTPLTDTNLCAVGTGEIARKSALSAVLIAS